jgi:hypothetical protein
MVTHPDATLPESIVRAKVCSGLSHCPKGARKAFARWLGYHGKDGLSSLKTLARGKGPLPDAARCRVSRRLNEWRRGEWALTSTGRPARKGNPSHYFVRRSKGSTPRGMVAFSL